jgi:hypothetical protein
MGFIFPTALGRLEISVSKALVHYKVKRMDPPAPAAEERSSALTAPLTAPLTAALC